MYRPEFWNLSSIHTPLDHQIFLYVLWVFEKKVTHKVINSWTKDIQREAACEMNTDLSKWGEEQYERTKQMQSTTES